MENTVKHQSGFTGYLVKAGCIIWSSWILLDYFAHHPDLTNAIVKMPYAGLLISCLLLGLGLGYLTNKRLRTATAEIKLNYRGIGVYLLVQLFAAIILSCFVNTAYIPKLATFSRLSYFFFFSGAFFLGLLLVITLAQVTGSLLLNPVAAVLSGRRDGVRIALGFSLVGLIAMLLAFAGLLKMLVVWPLVIGVLAWQWKAAFAFLQQLVWERKQITITNWWTPILFLVMFLILGVNWIGAFKTFPIGYDGAGLYVNLAEITATTGALPKGGQAFNWSVIMAFGQVLFSSRIFSILLSHLMSVLCFLMIFRIGRIFLRPSYALLGALLVFTAPYFGFHALVDEKTDLALTFVLLSTLVLILDSFKQQSLAQLQDLKLRLLGGRWKPSALQYLMVLTGWLTGYAFGVKYTTFFFLLGCFSWLAYHLGGRKLFGGVAFALLGSVLIFNVYRFGLLDVDRGAAVMTGLVFLAAGLGWIAFHYRSNWKALLPFFTSTSLLMLFFTLAFAPWGIKHLSEHGSIGIGQFIEGKAATPKLEIPQDSPGIGSTTEDSYGHFIRSTPGEEDVYAYLVQNNLEGAADDTKAKGADDEIRRYLGFETGVWLYTSLPYDVSMNTNVSGSRYTDLGYLLLLFFPLLLLLSPGKGSLLWVRLLLVAATPLWLATNFFSIYAKEGVLDLAATQESISKLFAAHPGGNTSWFYELYSAMVAPFLSLGKLLEPLYQLGSHATAVVSILMVTACCSLFFYLLRPRFQQLPIALKGLGALLLVYLGFWWLIGSGVVWYAMPALVLLPVIACWWLQQPESFMGAGGSRFSAIFLGVVMSLVLGGNVFTYYTSAFPGDTTTETIFRWPFVDYASNPNVREKKIFDAFNAAIVPSMKFMNTNMNDKIYRVNTHYGFLIEQNDTRVFSDPTLDKFNQLTNRFSDKSVFFDILKANGYRYVFLDLKTAFIDKSPEQNLRKRYIELANALVTSDKIQLISTDNYIQDTSAPAVRLPNGTRANARMGLRGQTVYLGNIALFEIR